MDIDIKLLKKLLKEKGYTGKQVASLLSIDESTYYRKLQDGGGGFSIKQIQRIAEILSVNNDLLRQIFFNH